MIHPYKKCIRGIKAFTLVELMVSLFIMSIATGLLLANYPNSTVRIELLNNTHRTSLLIREAQIRGSAVESASSTAGGYGVFINLATSSQVVLFSDSTQGPAPLFTDLGLINGPGFSIGNGVYDPQTSNDIIKDTLRWKEGFTFKNLCVASSSVAVDLTHAKYGYWCNDSGSQALPTAIPSIRTLTISYTRPSQTAHIYINGNTDVDFEGACIQIYSLRSPEVGHVRSIRVYHSGIVTTSTASCN